MHIQILSALKEPELLGETADFWTRRGYIKDKPGTCPGKWSSFQNQAERPATGPRCSHIYALMHQKESWLQLIKAHQIFRNISIHNDTNKSN